MTLLLNKLHKTGMARHTVGVLSVLTLVLGLTLTALGMNWLHRDAQGEAQVRFDRHVMALQSQIDGRFEKAMYGFKGLRSHYDAVGGQVRREAFRTWVASRNVPEDFPGIRGLGFIQRVPRTELAAFVAAEQADGAPQFQVTTSGLATDLYVIKYIEPLANNRKAWGYDIGSESTRREAAERAVRTGQSALTGRITLLQDGQKRPGFLYILPVFRQGMPTGTSAERQAALLGLIYSPIVVEEFLAGVIDASGSPLDFELFDGGQASTSALIFDLDKHIDSGKEAEYGHRAFRTTRSMVIGGRALTLQVSSTPAFEAEIDRRDFVWFGLGGCVLSVLLATTVWLMGLGRARAEAMARGMTGDLQTAKGRAEAALRESNALLATLNRYMLVSITDRSGRITDVNEAFCELSGYSRDELIGHTHKRINSGTHSAEFWREMWQTIAAGQTWSAEVCNRNKAGSLYWVQSIVVPFVGADGQIERYISIRTDITRLKQAQQELKDMAERFTLAIEGGNDGLWDWFDVNAHQEWWSPQFYRLLGYEPDEVEPDLVTFDSLLHPDHQERTFRAIEEAFKGLKPFDIEYQLRTKSGAYRWFRARAKVYLDDKGLASRMAGSIQDIHERRMAQEQIKVHGEQLDAIFSLSPDGFVSFDAQRRVSYASAAFTDLTGLAAPAVTELTEAEFLSLLTTQAVDSRPVHSFEELQGRAWGHAPKPIRDRMAHRVVIEMRPPARRLLELRMHQGTGTAVSQVLHLRDVTHETELDQMKSAFLSMAAHELRTPMASIYGFTELLLTREMKPEKQKDLMGRIYRQSEVMIAIINELLDLSRIEARQGSDFELESLDIVAVVAEGLHDYQPPAGREAPVLLPSGPMHIRADRQKLLQVLLNVLSNAYKYSPQGGRVVVDFPQREGLSGGAWHGVRVSDEGIGMSPEQLPHMGERFYRADKSGNIPGTGLGVSIVKEIMELMGGEMRVSSTLGQGTQVSLWLPALGHEAHAEAQSRQELLVAPS